MDEPNEVLSEKTGVADCTEASREASADHDRQAEGRTRRFPFRKARGLLSRLPYAQSPLA